MTFGPVSHIFEPGFLTNQPVRTALIVGAVVAAVSGVVGIFTVVRGQSFAGHALSDIGAAGGSGALFFGLSPLYGFLSMNVFAAGVMDMIGVRRPRGRDVATGIVLGAALAVTALFLYLVTTSSTTSGAPVTVLFGSIFTLSPDLVPVIVLLSVVAAGTVALLYRPLLLSSVSEDLAAARGVSVSLVGFCYALALAVAVSLSAITIGAILSTALLIGPAATALILSKRPGAALIIAVFLGVAETWLGVLLAYDSYYWFPAHPGLPVSFFVVAAIFVTYLIAQGASSLSRRARRSSFIAEAA